MLGISVDNITRVVRDLCDLHELVSSDTSVDFSFRVDTSELNDDSIREAKISLNDSIGELADNITTIINSALINKSTFDFPPSIEALVGRILIQNSIDRTEIRLQVLNILDRIFKLPVDREMSNSCHPQSKLYRKTSQIDPDLSTLVKTLIISPVVDAACREDECAIDEAVDEDYERTWLETEFNSDQDIEPSSLEAETSEFEQTMDIEYYNVIQSMPEISVPYLFSRLARDRDADSSIELMDVLSTMNLPAKNGSDYKKLLTEIIVDKVRKSTDGCSDDSELPKLYLALDIMSNFGKLSSTLEPVAERILTSGDYNRDFQFLALKILTKIDYNERNISNIARVQLLKRLISETDYSDHTLYAAVAFARNTKAVTAKDLGHLLGIVGKTVASRLVTALLIKIGQTRDDLKPIILDNLWSQIKSAAPNLDYPDCFEILQALSEDRTAVDTFIKSKSLKDHAIQILPLALGLHEYITQKYHLGHDSTIDSLRSQIFKDPDQGGLASTDPEYNIEQKIRLHKLAGDYNGLIQDLTSLDGGLRRMTAYHLLVYMHEATVIDKLKDIAIQSTDENLKQIIIDLLEFAAMGFNQCVEYDGNNIQEMTTENEVDDEIAETAGMSATDADDTEDDDPIGYNNGNNTATKLILGDSSEEIKAQALDAIFKIAFQSNSSELQKYASRSFSFLGTKAYEHINRTLNHDSQLQTRESQLTELIMLNSRYLRSQAV